MIDSWTIVVGFGMPVLIQWLVGANWSDRSKSLMAFVVCFLFAAVTALIDNKLSMTLPGWVFRIISDALLVFTIAISSYSKFWLKAGLVQRGWGAKTQQTPGLNTEGAGLSP